MMIRSTTCGHLVSTRLDQIVAATRRRVAAAKSTAKLCDLEKSAESSHSPWVSPGACISIRAPR